MQRPKASARKLHWPGFDMQACTYVEANGLFFHDCYEDTCRLPSAPRFEESVIIQMERYASDPQNTLKAYWPKISSFLKYKAEKLLVALQKAANEATDEDDDHARLHSRDLLVVAADYLEFLTAVQEGRAGPRVRKKGKRRIVEQDFDSEDIDLVMRDMGDMDIEQLGDSISVPNSLGNSNSQAVPMWYWVPATCTASLVVWRHASAKAQRSHHPHNRC
ncbi:TPA: hypothetical protein ACH3X3_012558 [Trebouxia sp. C0006]